MQARRDLCMVHSPMDRSPEEQLYDQLTERSVIACLVNQPHEHVLLQLLPLTARHFSHPDMGALWDLLRKEVETGGTTDLTAMAVRLEEAGHDPDDFFWPIARDYELSISPVMGAKHSARLRELAALRRLRSYYTHAAFDISQSQDRLGSIQETLKVMAAEEGVDGVLPPTYQTARDLWDSASPVPNDWVIPERIYSGQRVMIVAPEGVGKSTLLRQLTVAAAAGVDPFLQSRERYAGKRVLLVDAENEPRRAWNGLTLNGHVNPAAQWSMFKKVVGNWPKEEREEALENWMRVPEPMGLNLRLDSDQARLWNACEQHSVDGKLDLLALGPVYRLWRKLPSESWDDEAYGLQEVLDRLRLRFGCTILLEHHAAKGSAGSRDMTPLGSSAWMRWLEHGISFTKDKDLSRVVNGIEERVLKLGTFREPRDPTRWPTNLRYQPNGHHLPLVAFSPSGNVSES